MQTHYTEQKVEPARVAIKLTYDELINAVFQHVYKRQPTKEESERLVIHKHQGKNYDANEAVTLVFSDPPH